MIRLLVLLLVLANGAYFVWSQGLLRDWGLAPAQQGEPQRMAQQTQAGSLRILSAAELRAAEAAARAASLSSAQAAVAKNCLQAGLFDEAQAQSLRPALATALGSATWSLESARQTARWLLYMGKYSRPELLQKKRAELQEIQVLYTELTQGSLAPGLSLGTFESQADANHALARLNKQGVRTAKVLLERPAQEGYLLKLPDATENLRAKVQALGPALAGKPLQACQ